MHYRTVLSVDECQARLKAARLPFQRLLWTEPQEPIVAANVLGRWFRLWTYVVPVSGSPVCFYGRLRPSTTGTDIRGHVAPAYAVRLMQVGLAAMLLAILALTLVNAWWAAVFPVMLLGALWTAMRAEQRQQHARAKAYDTFLRDRLLAAPIKP